MPIEHQQIQDDVRRALQEDVGSGDITAALIPVDADATATVIARDAAIICGQPWFDEVFAQLDGAIAIDWQIAEGSEVEPNQVLCTLVGNARAILTGERSALNFLQTLSGTATAAHRFVAAVAGTNVTILDTRKTIPGLRRAQKYAVHCGGGRNHRIGLFDGVLIKENHILSAGSIANAVEAAKREAPKGVAIEVEVETLAEVEEALDAGADILLLDNMPPELLSQAVQLNGGRAKLEASGGIEIATIRAIAETGIDYISIGAITKHLHAVDLSMRFQLKQ